MSPLWRIAEFLAATEGRLEGGVPQPAWSDDETAGAISPMSITGISIDSRTVGPREAFFAIKGDRFDGHDFAEAALKRGAALAVVSEDRREELSGGPFVVVPDDPLKALERLGIAARARSHAKIVAVTGSVGKTGTKEMLRLVFSLLGETHAPVGSFNNHWGVPLTLARLPEKAAFGIFEIGMNHAGEISPLTRMVRPDVAIITTVGPVHIEFFGTVEAIADAKAEIFEGLEQGGTAILNRDNDQFDRLAGAARARGARIVSFGEHPDSDVSLVGLIEEASGSLVTADVFGDSVQYRLGAPGRHLATNSLSVLATVAVLGESPSAAGHALSGFSAPVGRGARTRLRIGEGSFTLIDESYNANPASMRAAIALLGAAEPASNGRRIAVLGDMGELGDQAPAFHAELVDNLATARADQIFLVGPLMHHLWNHLPERVQGAYAETAGEIEPILLDAIRPGDVVMVKASLSTGLGRLVAAVKERFPARDPSEKEES
ncbi:UDP-N-acetylmuramoyl-tripeptide--D-alanyl-D-alanine ligase [Rhodopseudomonas julia]|uniref:UDP-N-acetylmuramoyl-tripeptide--D-alanyl-D-alanine ligase n=1 Tax=Rhodopseudomonas julia TaxID=200617 RepID=A0ABU0C808_9BRAD|nr:UDP-N-acetylmuramoylalanyl-D-glutamyl-2,6-diaminopimelate--D-alanyl-D-alanine ligase [Rhodopseudomonas julia]MDQ0326655.1 UDP-N-acetylmuramoyl-tripeptide--D-alanyl-D-alanine ligase [Rhodopseudomonas julia]